MMNTSRAVAQAATVDDLLVDTILMRDMLVAGGATKGTQGGEAGSPAMYGQARAALETGMLTPHACTPCLHTMLAPHA